KVVPPVLTLVIAGLLLLAWYRGREADYNASRILSGVALDPAPSKSEVDLLWELATGEQAVRDSVLKQALEVPQNADRAFIRRGDMTVQALVGLDPDRRRKLLQQTVLPRLRDEQADLKIRLACVRIGLALAAEESDLAPDFVPAAGQVLTDALGVSPAPDAVPALAGALQAVAPKLAPEDTQRAVAQVGAAVPGLADPDALAALGEVLKSRPGKIAPTKARPAVDRFIQAIDTTNDVPKRLGLAGGVVAVVEK